MDKAIAANQETSLPPHTTEGEQDHSHDIKYIEDLTNELKRLLVSHEDTLNEEGIRREVETLERWMESYRRGLSAARKISETGASLLADLRNHLKLAISERHRLEDEGGNPAGKGDSQKIESLTKTMHHIDAMLPNIEHVFHVMELVHEEA